MAPLMMAKAEKTLDVFVNVNGGGTTGQAGATLLGIARALKIYDPGLAQALRDGGFLTRDPRMVERKKPGQSGIEGDTSSRNVNLQIDNSIITMAVENKLDGFFLRRNYGTCCDYWGKRIYGRRIN